MKERLKELISGKQRGGFIVFTALAMWFVLMFVAFTVDFANYYQHRSRLQSAADAAALAGVVKCPQKDSNDENTVTEKKTGRLKTLPSTAYAEDVTSFVINNITYTKTENGVNEAHTTAEEYVQDNYVQNDAKKSDVTIEDSIWYASTEGETVEITGGTQTTTTEGFYYRVDLEDTIDTFFARIFNVPTLPVKVTAVAYLEEETTTQNLFISISENLGTIIPNYYWETIVKKDGKITDTVTGTVETAKMYGANKNRYLTSDEQVDNAVHRLLSAVDKRDDGTYLIGYKQGTDGICAEPIYTSENLTPEEEKLLLNKEYVSTLVYDIDDEFIVHNGEDIFGLFLDMDNIKNKAGSHWYGSSDRFTEINIEKIRGYNPNVPIYVRIESEPVDVSGSGGNLTTVHGIDINVTLTENDFMAGGVKPIVIAYDGPDQARTIDMAPWTATENTPLPSAIAGKDPHQVGRINSGIEPLRKKYRDNGLSESSIPKTMVQTSVTTPGPVVITIDDGYVFNGVLYFPLSQVTIRGTGQINGFIVARRIVEENPCGRHFIKSQEVSMPTLVSKSFNSNYVTYERVYTTDYYNMVYSTFVDYTDTKYLPTSY